MDTVTANKDFALLVGKAFLRELEAGNRDGAIAFGRAFLLALGHKGPVASDKEAAVNGRERSHEMAHAET